MKKQSKNKARPKSKKRPVRQPSDAALRAVTGTVRGASGPSPAYRLSSISSAQARSRTYSSLAGVLGGNGRDDRVALALLLAPFLIVALSLGAERSIRQIVARVPHLVIAAQPISGPVAPPIGATKPARTSALETPRPTTVPAASPPSPPPVLPSLAFLIEPPPPVLPSLAFLIEPPPPVLPSLAFLVEPPPPVLPSLAFLVEPPPPVLPSLAFLVGLPTTASPICTARDGWPETNRSAIAPLAPPKDAVAFGLALSSAAQAQLGEFVIYNAKYQRIAYPMGDVAPMFGVCTDVIVRAYRRLGVDLQALVYETRSGRGDRNIDHRRVDVLRRFLTKQGAELAISNLAEDYQPGDIVTYYRPQNRSSTTHIAIVTDQLAPSGRPMIVHNRGWGPQLEDALFVDMITGHYRFSGRAEPAKMGDAGADRHRRVAKR